MSEHISTPASRERRPTVAVLGAGIAVRPLSPEEMRDNSLPNGLVVEDVAGAAARAGIRAGDVIVAVNNTPVKTPAQLKELVAKSGKTVALLIQRDDARIFVPVNLG